MIAGCDYYLIKNKDVNMEKYFDFRRGSWIANDQDAINLLNHNKSSYSRA